MKCPICKSILLEDKRRMFGDKSIIPRCFICSNCDCASFGMFWDEHGNIFDDSHKSFSTFVNENPMAFGSKARKLFMERLHPENSRIILKLWPFMWKLNKEFEANEDGEIKKVHNEINTLIWSYTIKNYHKWENPYTLYFECIKDFKETRKRYENGEDYLVVRLRDSFDPPEFDKRWGRRLASRWLKLAYRKFYKKIKNT